MSWLQGRTWFATPPPKGVAFPNRLLLYIFLIVRKWRENVYVLFLSRSLFSSSSSYWGLRFPLFVPASIWKEKKGRRNTGWGWERRKKKMYGGVRKEEMNHFLVVFHRWKKKLRNLSWVENIFCGDVLQIERLKKINSREINKIKSWEINAERLTRVEILTKNRRKYGTNNANAVTTWLDKKYQLILYIFF